MGTSNHTTTIQFEQHLRYFLLSLRKLPEQCSKLDSNRLTLVHFAVHSLDLLGFLEDEDHLFRCGTSKEAIINWIYSLQTSTCIPDERLVSEDCELDNKYYGFKGGTYLGEVPHNSLSWEYDHAHIAMTYTAICTLIALGDDLGQLDKKSVIHSLKVLQQQDGSFQCAPVGSENDMRFLYCACAISYVLNDWRGVNISKAIEYIRSCHTYDGAFSLLPGQEGHGGSTFCAVAALFLMGKIDEVLGSRRKELIHWCVMRQMQGMQGRPNKQEDTCYSFWIGGTLRLLESDHLLDQKALNAFVMDCQIDCVGGFSKLRNGLSPDLLHSFYSLAWLSLSTTSTSKERSINPDGSNMNSFDDTTNAKNEIIQTQQNKTNMSLSNLHSALGIRQERVEMYWNNGA